tara:strand:+ start:2275 stop:2592 length:318 start_codon:yes stop_codon:yes gene_type:complete
MKTFGDKKKEAEYLKKILLEEIILGKRGRVKIIRHHDGRYEVQEGVWKGRLFSHDEYELLIKEGSIDPVNTHELDDRPHKRALFYKHFNDKLQEYALKEYVKGKK